MGWGWGLHSFCPNGILLLLYSINTPTYDQNEEKDQSQCSKLDLAEHMAVRNETVDDSVGCHAASSLGRKKETKKSLTVKKNKYLLQHIFVEKSWC